MIDEAHSVQFDGRLESLRTAENRSLRLEWLGTRLIAHLSESRFIALSAVASGCENEIASWVTGEASARPERSAYRSTRQLIGRLECLPDRMFRILYDLADGDELQFEEDGRSNRPYIPNPFPPYPLVPVGKKLGPEQQLRPYLFWAAMHLAAPDDSGQQHSVLISITQQIGGYARDFLELLNSTWATEEKPEFFQSPTDARKKELWEKCKKSCADYFGEESREYCLLMEGVVVHHGKMPGLTARLLVEVIQQRIVNLVLATSTLSEGVNLPFETILIPTLRRGRQSISAREFSNLVGRVGRPGFGTEGRSLVLLRSTEQHSDDWSVKQAQNRYFSLIREVAIQDRTCDDALARSPLAELLNHLEEKWRIVADTTSRSAFLEWLEQTAPLEVEENTVSDGELTAIEALDSLDSLLLSAIVEIEQTSNMELSADELEERLKEIWQRSYARFASTEEAELGEVFIRRGQALRSDIYPEPIRRRRLYRTSLPPRSGEQMLKIYPSIKEHLETGAEYANWDCEEKFDYIRLAVKQISALPKFKLSEKAGRSTVNWQEVLRWWLDPNHTIKGPTPKQVSDWHNYVSQNFGYRINWGLGIIIALSMDDVYGDELHVPNVEDWPETGLPWIVFWLKELLVWGTLEPVAAYLLARGDEYIRAEAEEVARLYRDEHIQENDANEILNAVTVRDWVDSRSSRDISSAVSGPLHQIRVKLFKDFSNASKEQWRVVPVLSK